MSDRRRPPLRLLRAVNRFVKPILTSPLHPLLSGRVMLLSYTGRTSGRTYTTPVGYFAWGDGTLLSFSSSGWWRSLRDGRTVRLRLRGRWVDAFPVVEESPEARVELLAEFVRRYGPRLARRFYLDVPRDRPPTREELLRAASDRAVVRFRLRDRPA
jgi:hypothetical protein